MIKKIILFGLFLILLAFANSTLTTTHATNFSTLKQSPVHSSTTNNGNAKSDKSICCKDEAEDKDNHKDK